MKVPTKILERQLFQQGHDLVIGVDEVGMACLAGPVVVCALAVGPDFYERPHRDLAGLRDSKMLQPHQREQFAKLLMYRDDIHWEIASCEPVTIDEMNIYQASRLAMRRAIQKLTVASGQLPVVLVDGNKLIQGIDMPQRAIVKGDQKIWAIAAASIIAKVHRDALMTDYEVQYPGYGFAQHKGYPTQMHYERLRQRGPCPLHRRSFNLTR